jgi:S-DNA-T family DNA segregation ATPase FtsK/SpoIIIE
MASSSNTRKKTGSGTGKKTSGSRGASNKRKKAAQSTTIAEEIVLLLVFAAAILMLLANFNLCGKVGTVLQNTTFGLFGVLGYIVPILWMIYACFLVSNPRNTYLKLKLLLGLLLLICCCGICQLISMKTFVPENGIKEYYAASLSGKNGGGFFGGAMMMLLYPLFSRVGTWLILLVLIAVLVLVITEYSLLDFFRFHVSNFKDSYQENREIRELKNEQNRRRREELQAENRRRNGEKMLQARKDLELIKKTQVASRGADIPEGKVENPLNDVLEADSKRDEKKRGSKKIHRETTEERSRIPSFLLDDVPQEASKPDPLEDIISRELNRTKEPRRGVDDVEEISGVKQMNVSDYNDAAHPKTAPSSADQSTDKYYADGMPVQKHLKKEHQDDTRTVETGNGRVILVEPGTAGTSKVEAEGHESDPHGTGQRYKDEEHEKHTPEAQKEREYVFPPLNLLNRGVSSGRVNIDKELKETAVKLQQTLQNFGVRVNITNVSCGPAVTRYELQPEMGVKVSKIVALQDDIKLNLAAADIRIEAPIPGKAAIGIEVPNKENVAVNLRDLIEDEAFRKHKSKLAFATGKDIGGQTIIGDIAKMPHLLIAGATGSGKSVCINTIIVSILYHAKPSEVKLIMIDPKVVELSVYNGIPHLLKPVVTDPKQAAGALSWAVSEMTERYKRFAELGVRDINGYNEKIKEHFKGREEEMPKAMPQIVIIVDELADLMMVAPGEVEDSILHLAQMARAAGMHLILATQRPSVNVITGVIKANIPSRIAFAVSSGVDSRTILDMVGAEKLLGKGDMLYYPIGLQKPIRVQGAFVSDKEVSAVVEFLTQQGQVEGGGYDNKIDLAAVAAMTDAKSQLPAAPGEDGRDPLFKEAGNLIVTTEKASIGMLQRKFRIGFNRAARIMDQLSEAGIVGAEEGTKPRAILMTEEQFEAYCNAESL